MAIRMFRPVVVAAAVMIAAVTSTAGAVASQAAGPGVTTPVVSFAKPVVLPASGNSGTSGNPDPSKTCDLPCGEPSLAVSPVDGRLWVSTPRALLVCCNTQASPVWTSTDGGRTWSPPVFPSAPGGQNPLTGGDTELVVDKRGTVYEGELWLGSDSIYISADAGKTWSWSPASHGVLSDREWFAYSPSEDALYGVYDSFEGIEVVKAPLSTPAGSGAGLFFPYQRLVVPECPAGVITNCPGLPADQFAGVPVMDGVAAPGRPSVSPKDGTVYFPFDYQVAGQGVGIAATSDGGQTFQYTFVKGSGHGVFGDVGNDFPVTAVDAAGTLYAAWVENKGTGDQVYLAVSQDKGAHWTGPFDVSAGHASTAVFPNIAAGAAGRVVVSWYGTNSKGDPNNLPGASWNVQTATTLNATAASPTFSYATVQAGFHTGNICTGGSGCTTADRKLLDFFDTKIDKAGAALVVYARDLGAGTEIAFSRQATGCSLTTPGYSVTGVKTAGC